MNRPKLLVPLDEVTGTTTSDAIDIEGASRITLMFTRADHSAGASAFKVQVSIDGITWIDYNKLIDNVTNTNAQTLTRVTTATLSSDTSKIYSMDLEHDYFKWMKVVVTETTDGTHTAKALIEYAH